jgi:hypothetical protein
MARATIVSDNTATTANASANTGKCKENTRKGTGVTLQFVVSHYRQILKWPNTITEPK